METTLRWLNVKGFFFRLIIKKKIQKFYQIEPSLKKSVFLYFQQAKYKSAHLIQVLPKDIVS